MLHVCISVGRDEDTSSEPQTPKVAPRLAADDCRQLAREIAKQQSPPQVAASQVCRHAGVRKIGMTTDPVVSSISTVELNCLQQPTDTQSSCSSNQTQEIKGENPNKDNKHNTKNNTVYKAKFKNSPKRDSGGSLKSLLEDCENKSNEKTNLVASQKYNFVLNQSKVDQSQPCKTEINSSQLNEDDSMINTKVNSTSESEKKCLVF